MIERKMAMKFAYFVLFQLENCPLDRKTIITKTNESYVINRVITQGEVLMFVFPVF